MQCQWTLDGSVGPCETEPGISSHVGAGNSAQVFFENNFFITEPSLHPLYFFRVYLINFYLHFYYFLIAAVFGFFIQDHRFSNKILHFLFSVCMHT